jgi:hypothetical protein
LRGILESVQAPERMIALEKPTNARPPNTI